MVMRKGGARRKSRHVFRKNKREKGKISITKYLANYTKGDNVVLSAEPAIQKSLYHKRFHGKKGIVKAQRGNCYEVNIKDGSKIKMLILHPIHIKKL